MKALEYLKRLRVPLPSSSASPMEEKNEEIRGFFGSGLNPCGVMGPENIARLAFSVRSASASMTMRAG